MTAGPVDEARIGDEPDPVVLVILNAMVRDRRRGLEIAAAA
jgi:hypothetical protein